MQSETPRTKGWERSNLVRNAMEKKIESRQKKGMARWANNQMLTFSLAHDFMHV
jgi:hypothetical protein